MRGAEHAGTVRGTERHGQQLVRERDDARNHGGKAEHPPGARAESLDQVITGPDHVAWLGSGGCRRKRPVTLPERGSRPRQAQLPTYYTEGSVHAYPCPSPTRCGESDDRNNGAI